VAVATRRPPAGLLAWHWLTSSRWALPAASIAAVLALLELSSRAGILNPAYFPPVSECFRKLADLATERAFWHSVADTLRGWAIGLGIAAAVAIPLGIVIGSSMLLYRSTRAVVEFLRPIPSVALIPLAVLVYGTGLESKVFLVTYASFWPLFIQTMYGVQDVDPVALDTARSFGFGRSQQLARVTLPSSVPYVATGFRISSATALILAVTAELVIGSPGLGRDITVARSSGAVALTYALIIATGLIGWALNIAFTRGERRVLHWHPSHRAAAL
jgi:ABC-type nitrate/sulfonate/bicarbonate transport system permease component